METVTYKYVKTFETDEKAEAVAGYFHEVLRGNPDYVNTRILLNVSGSQVVLAEFSDSTTHIHVDEGNDPDNPILELFIA